MHPDSLCCMVGWKMDGPRHTACPAVTTAVHQAADAAEGITKRNARRHDVGHFPEWKFLQQEIKYGSGDGADESAIKDQSTVLNHENFRKRIFGILFVPIGNDVK